MFSDEKKTTNTQNKHAIENNFYTVARKQQPQKTSIFIGDAPKHG